MLLILATACFVALVPSAPNSSSPQPIYANPQMRTASRRIPLPQTFHGHEISNINRTRGIFIIRDPELVAGSTSQCVFRGHTPIAEDIRGPAPIGNYHTLFQFYSVKEFGGQWFTAYEHARQNLGMSPQEAATRGDWFFIEQGQNQGPQLQGGQRAIDWELRITSPAGKYGIRARAMTFGYETVWSESLNRYIDVETFRPIINPANNRPFDYYFTILYAEPFKYIRMYCDRNGNSVHSVSQHGRTVSINARANTGAVQMTFANQWVYSGLEGHDYVAGMFNSPIDVFVGQGPDVSVTITRGDLVVDNIPHTWRAGGIDITLPTNLPRGQYLVTITHVYRPEGRQVIGTFLIDNGALVPASNNNIGFGIIFVVLGFIGVTMGVLLVLAPKLAHSINAWRYKQIDKKIYGEDAKTMREREKQAKEKKEAIEQGLAERETPEERSFQARLQRSQRERHEARQAGLSIEDYRKQVEQMGTKEEIAKFGMADARNFMGEGIQIAERLEDDDRDKPVEINDGSPEFEILETLKRDRDTKADKFGELDKETKLDLIKPIKPLESGILGRIRDSIKEQQENKDEE